MTITNSWTGIIPRLSKSRQVIAVEVQGHGRTADINRAFSHDTLADDIAALLDDLKIKQADVLGYSMGGGVAMQVAIRPPARVRRVWSMTSWMPATEGQRSGERMTRYGVLPAMVLC